MVNPYLIKMTEQQKCEKLARAFEKIATKIRDPEISAQLWKLEGSSLQIIISQLGVILNRLSKLESPKSKNSKKEVDEWPDIIS